MRISDWSSDVCSSDLQGGRAMNDFLNQLVFGWYPYLAVTVLVVGSILRFDAAQYSWRAQSSQFLRRKQMILGSNLFRSEEHTSELQSLMRISYADFCLKKKNYCNLTTQLKITQIPPV